MKPVHLAILTHLYSGEQSGRQLRSVLPRYLTFGGRFHGFQMSAPKFYHVMWKMFVAGLVIPSEKTLVLDGEVIYERWYHISEYGIDVHNAACNYFYTINQIEL